MDNGIRKLINLIEQNDEPRVPITRTNIDREYSPRNLKKLKNVYYTDPTQGSFYTGKQDPRDPHAFRKHEKQPHPENYDAFVDYVDELERLNGSNPYLPVIYNVKRTGKHPHIRHKFTLEKLTAMTAVSRKDLIAVLERLLHSIHKDHGKMIYDDIKNELKGNLDPWYIKLYIIRRITFLLEDIVNKHIETNDQELLQAADIILKARQKNIESHYRHLDINPSNVMLRNTSKGYWPVFNDPVASRYYN